VKPSNILIDDRGNCLLTDFGIAKIVEATMQFTQTGAIIGTPAYMSPEQIRGESLDGRSDLYSLGIILFELATGRRPYRAETPPAVFVKHLHDPLPMPRELNPDIPEAVERVILKALAKDREHRYPTADALGRALADAVSEVKPASEESVETEIEPPQYAPTAGADLTPPHPPRAERAERVPPSQPQAPPRPQAGIRSWGWILGGVAVLVGVAAVAGVGLLAINALGGRLAQVEPTPALPTQIAPTLALPPVASSTPPAPAVPTFGAGASMESSVDGMGLLFVPAGEFAMGASDTDSDASDSEKPQHVVYLDVYWIDETEVSIRMYRLCVNAGACQPPARRGEFDDPDFADHAVQWVDWQDAKAYCTWAGRRLPTEAEWEKAARGTDGRRYPWGVSIAGNLLNFADRNLDEDWADATVDDGFEYGAPVGSYPAGASPYGALDMAGNLWEWVSDWYDPMYYLDSVSDNPQGPLSSPTGMHPVRGGSFLSNARNVRTAYRYGYSPSTATADLGFRCAVGDTVSPSTATTAPIPPLPSLPKAYGFSVCPERCTGSNATRAFPERTTRIYAEWEFEGIPVGADYTRVWTMDGREWVRYHCIWPGPESGTDMVTLRESEGLHSGTWEFTLTADGVVLIRERFTVEGTWDYWAPAGTFESCY
jgi:serine/threonine-protein kinase